MKSTIIFVILTFFLSGCKGCVGTFYKVHDDPTPINIGFSASDDLIRNLKVYIDSSERSRQLNSTKCPNALIELEEDNQIACLTIPNCECFFLKVVSGQIVIKGVFKPEVNDRSWLLFHEEVPEGFLDSMQVHFRREILDKL